MGNDNSYELFKMALFNDFGDCKREDVNHLISALVRMGYEVYMNKDYICFKVGNDDIIEKRSE